VTGLLSIEVTSGEGVKIVNRRTGDEWPIPMEFIPAIIVAANAALPHDDPRKVRREWVAELRRMAGEAEASDRRGEKDGPVVDPYICRSMADALESYLPPNA
jgi:hypothetical protein